MSNKHPLTVLLFSIFLSSCVFSISKESTDDKEKKKPLEGVVKAYYPDGKLKTEISYKNGKKNGLAREYFENGNVHLEINYVNDVNHGLTKRYYESGFIYHETPYDSGRIHGIEKKYRGEGQLMAEMPYRYGAPCKGLKEYTSDGSLRKKYPSIIITPVNTLLIDERYTLKLTMSDGSKNVSFFKGKLADGCWNDELVLLESSREHKGEGLDEYYIPRGGFIMQEINIVAKVKTRLGNYYITERKYNLAVDNRL